MSVSQGVGSVKRVGRAKPAAKSDSDEEKGEENGSNIDSGDVDSGLDSVSASVHILCTMTLCYVSQI